MTAVHTSARPPAVDGTALLVFDERLAQRPPRTGQSPAIGSDVHLWLMDLAAETLDGARCQALLDREEAERACRFAFPVHRDRFVRRHALTRHVLASYLECAPEDIGFAYGEYGKPRLAFPANHHGVQFSLSSSEDLAVLAVARGRMVGADVEVPTAAKREAWRSVAATAFHREETAALLRLPSEPGGEAFFRLWTLKEAYCKALGSGLQILERAPLLHVPASDGRCGIHPLFHDGRNWLCRCLPLSDGAVASLVVKQ